ncbi:MAG: TIGR01777 family protein [Phycisphaera sp.]|nr:TIGR01777 family protein [Phycisphaera sp.]
MSVSLNHERNGSDRVFRAESDLPFPVEDLAAWHFRMGALDRLLPPWQDVRVIEDAGEMRAGAETVLSVPLGPIRKSWHARIEEAEPGRRFVDVQVSGPFGAWRHEHRFQATQEGSGAMSRLVDEIHYRMPLAPLGDLGASFAAGDLDRLFRWRHWRTGMDLLRHEEAGCTRPLRVVVTGSSGLVGRQLVAFLRTGGHEVRTLVRREPDRDLGEFRWNPEAGSIDTAAFEGVDAVVHLAGAGIADQRWTDERMRVIRESRTRGTAVLAETLAALSSRPPVLVSASAVGWYGDRQETVDDASPPGEGWLAEVGVDWENAADAARAAGIRVVHPRIGIVLTPKGGALAKMLPPFRLGGGGRVGSGTQGMSWIGLDDLLGVLLRAITDDSLEGGINATAPEPVSQMEFAKTLAGVLRRPAILPLPAFAVRAAFGRMAEPLLLQGVRALPSTLIDSGFRFETPSLKSCLEVLLDGTPPVIASHGAEATA